MFKLFNKRSKADKLHKRYAVLMEQNHALSKTNRALADQKYAQAQEVLRQLEVLDQGSRPTFSQ